MISYYIGMFFFIFCDLTNDIPIIANDYDEKNEYYNNFIQYFGLDEKSPYD